MSFDLRVLRQKSNEAFAQSDYVSTLNALEKMVELAGPHAELVNNLAVVHYKLGNVQVAIQHFREALALQGESQHLVANNLLDILEEQTTLIERLRQPSLNQGPPAMASPAIVLEPVKPYCPVCKKPNVHFLPIPEFFRDNAIRHGFKHYGRGEMTAHDTYSCSHCGASDRERLYVFWLEQEIAAGRLQEGQRLIHFAPEAVMSRLIKGSQFFDYSTADLMMGGVDYKVDLMDMPFEDAKFDFFICSHVLEHVADDGKAIRELHRITRPGGKGILMAPIIVGLDQTQEDPSVVDEAERWRLYGQNDHVRLYAHDDYVRKIEDGGFYVDQFGVDYFGVDIFKALGLKCSSVLYIASKK